MRCKAFAANFGGLFFSAISETIHASKYSFATFFEIDKIYALSHRSQLEKFANIDYVFDGILNITCHFFPPTRLILGQSLPLKNISISMNFGP